MGAEAYFYVVEYKENIKQVLQEVREEVFDKGDYRYSELKPATIAEAKMNAAEEGTASILDIYGVSEHHQMGFLSPLLEHEYLGYFGTKTPEQSDISKNHKFWDSIGRSEARYVIIFSDGQPTQLFIAGYSAD